jgi:methylenetetrahydrofolate dehydrogenase (NADP+)/methenyltetrahydrofolate cyclohydrolase
VIETISPAKDVDGFHVASAGALMGAAGLLAVHALRLPEDAGEHRLRPARQARGGHRPQQHRRQADGLMLLQKNATVTICHSRTAKDLKAFTLQADVVVAAVGKRNVLTADMVKPGAVVIDVGMNRNEEGKLCGDVDFDGVQGGRGLDHPGPGRRRAR